MDTDSEILNYFLEADANMEMLKWDLYIHTSDRWLLETPFEKKVSLTPLDWIKQDLELDDSNNKNNHEEELLKLKAKYATEYKLPPTPPPTESKIMKKSFSSHLPLPTFRTRLPVSQK